MAMGQKCQAAIVGFTIPRLLAVATADKSRPHLVEVNVSQGQDMDEHP